MKLSLGFSPCPNDTFIFDALVHHKIQHDFNFDVHIEDIQTLNHWALKGQLDVTKLSYYAYLFMRDQYTLLRAGGALGHGVGPLLISRAVKSPQDVNNGVIAVPGEYTTAHILFRMFYPDAKNRIFMPFDQIEREVLSGRADAGVIIHENRFTYAEKGLVLIHDLGELWEQETGHPIPLGAIVARKSLSDKTLLNLNQSLRASLDFALVNPRSSVSYVEQHAQEMQPEVMAKHIETYVNSYSRDLGQDGLAAVAELEDRARQRGII